MAFPQPSPDNCDPEDVAGVLEEPTSFWGKLRRAPSGACEWHPLTDHCADVGAVAEALLELPLWRQRFSRLAGQDLAATNRARLAAIATLHDLGKFNLGFQAKGRPDLGSTAGHVEEALAALFNSDLLSFVGELDTWGEGATGLVVSAICHHGKPHNIDAACGKWQRAWWSARAGLDPVAACRQLLESCRRWFPRAFEDAEDLPAGAAFEHAFAGLVMLSDWIASDTEFFPFTAEAGCADDRIRFARVRAREALSAMSIDVPATRRKDPENRSPFSRVTPPGLVARPAQAEICRLPRDTDGSITVLESETGSGKTEAVLARFVDLFEEGLVDGLYFALPTRSAASQMHRRVLEAAQRAFLQPPPVVLAVPGYLRVDDAEGQRLPHFEVLWPDRDRFRYRAWAAENPKRYLVGCIVVGTIDQVLLSSLMVGHAHLRASALLRHLLVVDEVHASDAYMTRILQDVLGRHFSAGGHSLLVSATLGAETRSRLVSPREMPVPISLGEAVATPYPLVTHRSADIQALAVATEADERVVNVKTEPWLEQPEAVVERALSAAIAGAKALVLRNTVKDCIATQLALERAARQQGRGDLLFRCAGVPAPHHARFSQADRLALDAALETRLGKVREESGCVVVATQTVQQSLDIDADILLTDLCPADILLQRLGRLHRHRRHRPPGFEVARAIMLVPGDRDLGVLIRDDGTARSHHGLGSVYPDLRQLEATWRLLDDYAEWRIPGMNRLLVEHSLHSAALEAVVQAGGDRWNAHAVQMIGSERGLARQAELNLVPWSRPYSETSFPADQRIATRLGEGDRLVRFDPSVPGPFEASFSELVLREWWTRGVPPDLDTATVVSAGSGVLFRLGGAAFRYDRLGLRPEASALEESFDDAP